MDINIVKLLIDHGADPFSSNNILLKGACKDNNIPLFEYLISIGAKCSDIDDLTIACAFSKYCDLELKKILLCNGTDPNMIVCDGSRILECAICNNDIDTCKLLIEYGADINLCYNADRATSPTYIFGRIKPIIDLFLEYGVDIREIL